MASPGAPADDHVLAVDIGGTKFAAGIIDRSGSVVWEDRSPTPVTSDAEELWRALEILLSARPAQPEVSVVGVGSGGPMSERGDFVSPLNIPAWRDFPLKARLADLTGRSVWVDNDAKALALAEGWLGTAIGERNYISMVVSTGVGGGIVLDGRLLEGRTGNAGHIGHVIVEPEGAPCGCGGRGCLEAEASGTAIERLTGRPAAEASPTVVQRTGILVGRGIATVANLVDLHLATVSGSVALGFGEPFFTAAQQEIDRRCRLDFSAGCRVVQSTLGARGPLLGAAAVGWEGFAGG